MVHFALICPPYFSHLRVFDALAEGLGARGHRVTWVLPDGAGDGESGDRRPAIRVKGGPSPDRLARLARRPGGLFGILRTVAAGAKATDALCRETPEALRSAGVDAILGDEFEPAAGLIARHLRLPQISVAAALPSQDDPGLPLPFLSWPYDPTPAGAKRDRGGERVARHLMRRQRRTVEDWSARFGLTGMSDPRACLSPILRLAQTVAEFDFPRPSGTPLLPVGPIRALGGDPPSRHRAPVGPGTDRPLVFASLGTLQGHRLDLFRAIADAARGRNCRLVVAHCGGLTQHQAARIDADLVTDFVDQAAILDAADVCITHGGLNTVLDALTRDTPLVTLPIAFDQPGIGARVAHHGVGETIPAGRASTRRIAERLDRILADPAAYHHRIAPIRASILAAGGLGAALDAIERAVASTPPQKRSEPGGLRQGDRIAEPAFSLCPRP